MEQQNHMQVVFDAKSENEGLARMLVTAFMSEMNPTLEQIADVKTAVSEAVTNAIITRKNVKHRLTKRWVTLPFSVFVIFIKKFLTGCRISPAT